CTVHGGRGGGPETAGRLLASSGLGRAAGAAQAVAGMVSQGSGASAGQRRRLLQPGLQSLLARRMDGVKQAFAPCLATESRARSGAQQPGSGAGETWTK